MIFAQVLVIILTLGALVYVIRPMIRGSAHIRRVGERRILLQEERAALLLLSELEHDRQTGKLDEEDYSRQMSVAERRAIEAMRRLDALGGASGGDEVEALVRLERVRLERETRR